MKKLIRTDILFMLQLIFFSSINFFGYTTEFIMYLVKKLCKVVSVDYIKVFID